MTDLGSFSTTISGATPTPSMIHSPLGGGEAELGDVHGAAVDERTAVGDADDAAPTALANERAETGFTEHGREDVAVRGGGFVQQADERGRG
jgi:hypothetical protein